MKYIALLRGVNVGGKGKISMAEIKTSFEKAGYTNVKTYINSGNIIFSSPEKSISSLTASIKELFAKEFFAIDTVILSHDHLKDVADSVPSGWKKNDVRKYVSFLPTSVKPEEIVAVANVKEGVDMIDVGPQVVYMTTKMTGLTKSGFPKLMTHPLYKKITIRNYNTVQKLLTLLEA